MSAVTALVSWSHSDPDWAADQQAQWARTVLRFAELLRGSGIDAHVDLYYSNEPVDWTRWGPKWVDDADVVLVVVSHAWRRAWEGRGDPTAGAGAAAEADALKSLYNRNRDDFRERVRLVVLPDVGADAVPTGLDVLVRYPIRSLDQDGIDDLVRDLTNQPRYTIPPLGSVPHLPPEPLDPTHPVADVEPEPPSDGGVTYTGLTEQLTVQWREEWDRAVANGPTALTLHCLPVPARPVSARDFVGVNQRLVQALRASGAAADDLALTQAEDATGTAVPVNRPRRRHDEVTNGAIEGVRMGRNGQLSVWMTLPEDRMGAVLDAGALTDSIADALGLVDTVWGPGPVNFAVALELNAVIRITDGSISDLGRRSRVTMTGAMRPDLKIDADESIGVDDLNARRQAVASGLAAVVLHQWHSPTV